MEYRTCTYIRDDGNLCNSAAVTDRNLCLYHLEHRARLMRMAQYRARGQRFDLILPPLESMHAVQSALTQLSEALAADMIELKRADRLIRVLNIASRNLLKADKWPASPYHSDQPAAAIDLTARYALPSDLDLNLAPDVAFPQAANPQGVILSEERSDESKDPFVSPHRVGGSSFTDNWLPATGNLSPMPTVDYCDHGPGCPEHTIRADYPETPELAELREIKATQGMDAVTERYKQQQRNQRRREVKVGRKRYVAIALEKNMRLAAERLAERKLAERAAQPVAEVGGGCPVQGREAALGGSGTDASSGYPIPTSGGAAVGPLPTDENAAAKKPPASVAITSDTIASKEEATA